MPEEARAAVQRGVRDGIPVYWGEGPQFCGLLSFRAGRADETVIGGGVSHLVEHLALHGLGARQPYSFNGRVDGLRTSFWATGTPEEVASFMSHVCAALRELPLERLEAESRILRTEASRREMGFTELALWYRFGWRSHGLAALHEYAIDAPDPASLSTWARDRFTAENAAAFFGGPVPPGLGFEALPRGRRVPCPEPVPIAALQTPAFLNARTGAVVLSGVNRRDDWIVLSLGIAEQRIQERLRYREALTYSIQRDHFPLDATHTHSMIWIACLDEHALAVQRGLIEVLEDLARDGPTREELDEMASTLSRQRAHPGYILSDLESAVLNDLIGARIYSGEELQAELAGMTPQRCAAALQGLLSTAVLILPAGCPPCRSSYKPYPAQPGVRASGRRFHAAAQRLSWSKKHPRLVVGRDGVSLLSPDDRTIATVLYQSCAGAVVHPGGVLRLIGEDGFDIWIDPTYWREGEWACQAALRGVPMDRVLVLGSGRAVPGRAARPGQPDPCGAGD